MTTTTTPATNIISNAQRRAEEIANAKFELPAKPADRSRNGRRIPRSVKHRGLR